MPLWLHFCTFVPQEQSDVDTRMSAYACQEFEVFLLINSFNIVLLAD